MSTSTAGGGGKPWRSSSAIVADTASGYHILRIDGYSGTKVRSTKTTYLLLTENGADVVFEVGSQTFAAHRCVLAARSPVFKAELFGTMKESVTTGIVCIDDIEAQVFKALLYFIYTDSLPKAKKEEGEEEEDDVMSQHLLVAADKYNLERLKLICEDKLCKYIDVGTVATILALAEQHHCTRLKKACFDFLSSPTNLKAAVDTDGFKHLSRSCPAIMEDLIVMLGNLVL
ncbi:unnamed protein product [Urochloa decumbens]|uniref:BTB domain-containing protein n=1 Tax=Urochloa decumbens TaxID=240449 RepID=A0ABC8WXW4_9POAL